MADISFKLHFDLGSVLEISAVVNKAVFPLLNQAVRAVAQQTAADWQKAVYQAKLWSGEKDSYAKSITWTMTGDFKAVVEASYKLAEEIERGRPPRDLKKMLNTSLKVRRTTKGSRFLIIPFRHNTPGNSASGNEMPDHVYQEAKGLTASSIIGQGQRRSGEITTSVFGRGMRPLGENRQRRNPYLSSLATKAAMTVNKNQYSWGGKLAPGSLGPNPKGKVDRFAGMHRFETSTPGGGKSSSYLTFRVMSEKSKGWIVPAQPGQPIAQGVQAKMQPKAQAAFSEAIKRTLAAK